MNIDKLIDKFVNDYTNLSLYAKKEEVYYYLSNMKELIIKNKDKTTEEIIDLMLRDNIKEIDDIRKKYGIPGYTVGMKVGNIKIKLYGGSLNYLNDEMTDNALFDIASMTKFYTQVICYNLMREGYFKYNDKIIDLDNRFINLNDLTVSDILTFGTTFQTEMRIAFAKDKEEAKNILYKANVIQKNKYNYNDIGMMIIKEVMEKVTGLTYNELLDKYIIKAYNLDNTYLVVPKDKYKLITGTPNFKIGHINDASANVLGGYSGHAGIFSSSDDLIKFMMGVHKSSIGISDAYTKGKLNDAIGIMGNVYISHPLGLEKSFVDTLEPSNTIAIQGSTRVNANSSNDSAHNILFNPSSMSMEEAKERINKINEEREKEGMSRVNPLREYELSDNGNIVNYKLIDPRLLLPLSEMEKVIKRNAITVLKLRFLNEIINNYARENESEIDYVHNTNSKI